MIRVAIADDSRFTCRLLASHLESSGLCRVIGTACDAASTLELVRAEQPDVLTLDLEMPGGGGLGLLHRLMAESPLRVVVISGVSKRAAATTLKALDLGAVDFILKYTAGVRTNPDALRREILAKVTAAATAALSRVARPVPAVPVPRVHAATVPPAPGVSRAPRPSTCAGVVVIGASTGGPTAVRIVLAELPADFPYAVLVVQHLPATFTAHFASVLAESLALPVAEALPAQRLEAGRALVAPGGSHTLVSPTGTLEIRAASERDLYRPSIDIAMQSAAEVFGANATGVVLTGMGSDGANGLTSIRSHGGLAFIQAPESCVIASMPARALEAAGADYVGQPDEIGRALARTRRGRVA